MNLGFQRGISDVRRSIKKHEKVIYRRNGNRTLKARELLKKIGPLLPKVGITRVADISHLARYPFPVIQATVPSVHFHHAFGRISSSLGKGLTKEQAMASSLMEAIEYYCAEPRNIRLIKGRFDWLNKQHIIINPTCLQISDASKPPRLDETLMWTPAYSTLLDSEILIPAEAVFFPFFPKVYETSPYFPTISKGLASGATILEAVVHAIYELLERAYLSLFNFGVLNVEALFELEISGVDVKDFYIKTRGDYELQIFSLRVPWFKKNLPMIHVKILGDNRRSVGNGCAGDVDTAIQRAVSEAFQSEAIWFSGLREDLFKKKEAAASKGSETREVSRLEMIDVKWSAFPKARTLKVSELKQKVVDEKFDDLHSEFLFLKAWLKTIGCPEILVANLTRVGIDVPVVKVIIPGLPLWFLNTGEISGEMIQERLYSCRKV